MAKANQQGFKPPYIAFQTFWKFIEDLSAHPLPPLIDRSMMTSKSGTDQTSLIGTLRALDLIDSDQRVLPGLTELANADKEHQRILLSQLLNEHYAEALEVSVSNGTSTQLEQCFRDVYSVASADTLRKSVTFFLHASRAAGAPLSPHFKRTRRGQGASGSPRKRTPSRKPKNVTFEPVRAIHQQTSSQDPYQLSVRLQTGGTMTLTVNVNPIGLRGGDREFFYSIIDKMTDSNQPEDSEFTGDVEGESVKEI